MRHAARTAPLLAAALLAGVEPPPSPAPKSELTFHQELAWSPDGTRIAFSSMTVPRQRWEKERSGALKDSRYDIHVMRSDGTDLRRLTSNPGDDLWLSWSPDGERIVFGSERDGNADLYLMSADGSNQTRLTHDPGRESGPSWSPDGSRIAYMAKPKRHWEIWVMDAGGTGARKLTGSSADDSNPVWSPDGTRIVFYSSRGGAGRDQVFVVSAGGSGPPRAVAPGVFPAWSPDGESIIYGHQGLNVIDADGSSSRRLVEDSEFGRFSPDGTKIAFVAGGFPDTSIGVMNAEGGARVRLTR